MTDIKLRPYQQNFIDAVRNEFLHDHKRVVGVAPCGAGKTVMTGWMIKEALERGKRSLFFVHRRELIQQTSATFNALEIPHGIISSEHKMQPDLPVQIASVQTLARRIEKIQPPDFLICDECHHILAETYNKILDAFPDAYLLGVTATPERMGGITLCDAFAAMVESLSVDELIKLGNLTPFNYFAPEVGVDLHKVRIKFGEYNQADLERVMSAKQIIGGIVENYTKLAANKSAICYCVNVEHSETVAAAFNRAGIPAAHCDGDTPKKMSADIVENFRRGEIKVLCNADLFGEGFDVPKCQAVILARPTKSLTLYIQQAMRSMRPDPDDPNKVAVIIDHVQNYLRHGLPNDERHWSLEPYSSKIPGDQPPPRLCPSCGLVIPSRLFICPHCGKQIKTDGVMEKTGDTLAQVAVKHDTKKKPIAVKHSFTKPDELLTLAKRRNYKIGWVAFQALKYAQTYDDCLRIAEVCNYNTGWAWYKWKELERIGRARK